MNRLLSTTLVLTLATACQPQADVDEIRAAIPRAESVQVKVPGAAAKIRDGEAGGTLMAVGDLATFYQFTRATSRDLNGGAAFVLILVHTIVQFPVTSIDGDTYIWGPWTETLNPSEFRLTVREDTDGSYLWSLEGRRKADGPTAVYQAVVAGDAMPGAVEHRGSGVFTMDFDTAEQLDPAGNDAAGSLDVVYDLTGDPAWVSMGFETFAPTPEGGVELATFSYEYSELSDGSGDFQFGIHADLDDNGSAWENADIRSRWLPSGAGRADVTIVGGDAGEITIDVSECWDPAFGRVYYTDSVGWQPTEGDAGSCAITTALPPSI